MCEREGGGKLVRCVTCQIRACMESTCSTLWEERTLSDLCVPLCFDARGHTLGSGVKTHTKSTDLALCLLAEQLNVSGLDSAGNLSKSESGGLPG